MVQFDAHVNVLYGLLTYKASMCYLGYLGIWMAYDSRKLTSEPKPLCVCVFLDYGKWVRAYFKGKRLNLAELEKHRVILFGFEAFCALSFFLNGWPQMMHRPTKEKTSMFGSEAFSALSFYLNSWPQLMQVYILL